MGRSSETASSGGSNTKGGLLKEVVNIAVSQTAEQQFVGLYVQHPYHFQQRVIERSEN